MGTISMAMQETDSSIALISRSRDNSIGRRYANGRATHDGAMEYST